MRNTQDQLLKMIRDKRYTNYVVYLHFAAVFPIPCIDPTDDYRRVISLIEQKRPAVLTIIKDLAKVRTAKR